MKLFKHIESIDLLQETKDQSECVKVCFLTSSLSLSIVEVFDVIMPLYSLNDYAILLSCSEKTVSHANCKYIIELLRSTQMSVSRKGQERTDPGMTSQNKSTVRDMTTGSITGHLIAFSIPLLLGNVFQMLYNTSTTMIVNIMIFFFNGFAVGGGVVISQYFGAKRLDDLHKAIETAIAVTILFGIFFTFASSLHLRAFFSCLSCFA